MTANRSLDEFAGADGEAPESDDPVAEGTTEREDDGAAGMVADDATGDGLDETVEPDASATSGDVIPATSTYAWSPEGGPCAACGERAQERWREGDDLVCAGCKDW